MSELTDRVMAELVERYGSKWKPNPAWDRKAERRAMARGEEYDVPQHSPRSFEEMALLGTCFTVDWREDGSSIRALTFAEIIDVVTAAEAAMAKETPCP